MYSKIKNHKKHKNIINEYMYLNKKIEFKYIK